jgi:inner membrane protein involved in colicin E2 resistance
MCFTLAQLGKIGAYFILLIFGEESGWIGSIILFILLVIVLVILFKVDWEKVLDKYVKVGASKNENNCRPSHA